MYVLERAPYFLFIFVCVAVASLDVRIIMAFARFNSQAIYRVFLVDYFLERISDSQKYLFQVLKIAHNYHRTWKFLNHTSLVSFLEIFFTRGSFFNFNASIAKDGKAHVTSSAPMAPHSSSIAPISCFRRIGHIICASHSASDKSVAQQAQVRAAGRGWPVKTAVRYPLSLA